jgi:hypothetical protein
LLFVWPAWVPLSAVAPFLPAGMPSFLLCPFCSMVLQILTSGVLKFVSHFWHQLYRDGGTCWEWQTQPLNFHSLYLFPTPPSVLHHCRARILELSNGRLSNSRTVDSRTLEPSTLDLSNSRIHWLAILFYSSPSRLANRFLIARFFLVISLHSPGVGPKVASGLTE